MTSTQLDKLSLIAIQATLDAGKEILEVYNNEETLVDYKGDDSPLTQADTRAHLAIVKLLDGTGIPVLSEEGKHLPFEDRTGHQPTPTAAVGSATAQDGVLGAAGH